MWSALFISAILAQAPAAGQAPAPSDQSPIATVPASPPNNWLVIVAAPVYQPDGAVTAETVNLPSAGAGLVHLFARRSLCDPAVAGAAEPTDARFGWRIASQIVSRSEKDLVVSIDWRRVWDAGRKVSGGPNGTVQLTLHPGDRIPLDHIANTTPRADCRAVGLGLEVRLARPAATSPATPPAASALPMGATAGGEKAVDADLWLLHTLPSGAQHVTHQVVRLEKLGGKFGFAPTPVATARGDIRVELTGSIDRFRVPTGGEFLLLSMTRLVTGEFLPPDGVAGTTSTVVPMPVGTDVLSFEIPGVRRMAAGGRGGAGTGAVAAGGTGGGGAGSTGTGAVVTRTPPPSSGTAGGAQSANPAQGGARIIAPPGGREAAANNAQIAALLEGHQFAIRLKVSQVY
jgi:hypothetical protein